MRFWRLVVILCCVSSAPALAGDKAAAEAAFQRGKSLMKAGSFADACGAFEKSQALDPQLGTEYNLATCYEALGKLASAWAEFREVAQRDTNVARRREAAKHAAALAPRLSKLTITATAPVATLRVTRNGQDVSQLVGVESPVDPGDYEIAAQADGYQRWSTHVAVRQEGGAQQVSVPALVPVPEVKPAAVVEVAPAPRPEAVRTVVAPPAAPSSRKPLALIVGGSGLAVTAAGLVVGALASSKWSAVKKACGGDSADGCDATGAAFAKARDDQRSAHTLGTASTVLVGVGVAAVVAGVVLYVTSPSGERIALVPTASPDGVALSASGRF